MNSRFRFIVWCLLGGGEKSIGCVVIQCDSCGQVSVISVLLKIMFCRKVFSYQFCQMGSCFWVERWWLKVQSSVFVELNIVVMKYSGMKNSQVCRVCSLCVVLMVWQFSVSMVKFSGLVQVKIVVQVGVMLVFSVSMKVVSQVGRVFQCQLKYSVYYRYSGMGGQNVRKVVVLFRFSGMLDQFWCMVVSFSRMQVSRVSVQLFRMIQCLVGVLLCYSVCGDRLFGIFGFGFVGCCSGFMLVVGLWVGVEDC